MSSEKALLPHGRYVRRGTKLVAMPREVEPLVCGGYRDPRTGTEYDVLWDGRGPLMPEWPGSYEASDRRVGHAHFKTQGSR